MSATRSLQGRSSHRCPPWIMIHAWTKLTGSIVKQWTKIQTWFASVLKMQLVNGWWRMHGMKGIWVSLRHGAFGLENLPVFQSNRTLGLGKYLFQFSLVNELHGRRVWPLMPENLPPSVAWETQKAKTLCSFGWTDPPKKEKDKQHSREYLLIHWVTAPFSVARLRTARISALTSDYNHTISALMRGRTVGDFWNWKSYIFNVFLKSGLPPT